jgi:hypothetical protein
MWKLTAAAAAALVAAAIAANAAPLERMSPRLLARVASALSVYSNVCSLYFPVDVDRERKLQEIAVELGRINSLAAELERTKSIDPNAFKDALKQEIERRYAEVKKTGEWDWCVAKRKDYDEPYPYKKPRETTPEQFAWALAGLSVGSKICKWQDAIDAMGFIERRYLEDLTEYDTRGPYVQLVDKSVNTMLRDIKVNGLRASCTKLRQQMRSYLVDYPGLGKW